MKYKAEFSKKGVTFFMDFFGDYNTVWDVAEQVAEKLGVSFVTLHSMP